MKKILALLVITSSVLLPFSMARAACDLSDDSRKCAAFEFVNLIVTPLPVSDSKTNGSQTMTQAQQLWQTLESFLEVTTDLSRLAKTSQGLTFSQDIPSLGVPEIKEMNKGSESLVAAYAGKSPNVEGGNVSFEKADKVAETTKAAAVVANPVGNVEEQAAREKKAAFIQQSVMELVARSLYYKNQLEELKKTDTSAQGTSGSKDTAGAVDVSIQIQDAVNRAQTLENQLLAMRNELAAIQNLKLADTIPELPNVGES